MTDDIEVDPYDLSDDQSDAVTRLALRDEIARAYDPEAFQEHDIERRSTIAAIQWGARRHLALEAADRFMPWITEHDRKVRERAAARVAALNLEPLHDSSPGKFDATWNEAIKAATERALSDDVAPGGA